MVTEDRCSESQRAELACVAGFSEAHLPVTLAVDSVPLGGEETPGPDRPRLTSEPPACHSRRWSFPRPDARGGRAIAKPSSDALSCDSYGPSLALAHLAGHSSWSLCPFPGRGCRREPQQCALQCRRGRGVSQTSRSCLPLRPVTRRPAMEGRRRAARTGPSAPLTAVPAGERGAPDSGRCRRLGSCRVAARRAWLARGRQSPGRWGGGQAASGTRPEQVGTWGPAPGPQQGAQPFPY